MCVTVLANVGSDLVQTNLERSRFPWRLTCEVATATNGKLQAPPMGANTGAGVGLLDFPGKPTEGGGGGGRGIAGRVWVAHSGSMEEPLCWWVLQWGQRGSVALGGSAAPRPKAAPPEPRFHSDP